MVTTASEQNAQPIQRVAFLGPVGTFTEQALQREDDLADADLVPCDSMVDVLFAVHEGTADAGVVPIENAIEGTVNATIDTLAMDVDVLIGRELLEPVAMNLLATPGTELGAITSVSSIPVATAQCRGWLRNSLPNAAHLAANSTAEAAAAVAKAADPTVAAIGNTRAAEVYGLDVLASGIEDHPENQTRFVVVRKGVVPAPTGHDKTSIVVYQRTDEPGSLMSILQEFAARRINLTLLLSRPTKVSLGDYCFVLDLEGHIADEVVADCLRMLKSTQGDVKYLGSYPAAGADGPARRAEADAAGATATEWIEALRTQIR